MSIKHLLVKAVFALCSTAFFMQSASAEEPFVPWRVNDSLELPEWLKLSGNARARFEHTDGVFQGGVDGNDQVLLFRTRIKAEITRGEMDIVAELADSRQSQADDNSKVTSSMVNTFAISQAYVGYHYRSMFSLNSDNYVKIGRQTMDLGSRRLVARNGYRNTMNNFNGINNNWQLDSGESITAFYMFPVVRTPSERNDLVDNKYEFDEENFKSNFLGVFANSSTLIDDANTELFLFGLIEEDGPDFTTRNRDLLTLGARVYTRPSIGEYDYEFETMWQTGKSRESAALSDQDNLDHFAHFHHAEIGYTLTDEHETRVSLELDYASGDKDPDDGKNNRFDTLYGARRGDFGPTSLYGPFARSNLIAGGFRLEYFPRDKISVMIADKFYWLASDKDAWSTTGIRDETGKSDRYLGNQIEARLRWDPLPYNLRFEFGAAYLFTGSFVHDVRDKVEQEIPTTSTNPIYENDKTDQSMFYMSVLATF
ncbi:alginate export family protein [Thalassomonas sp. M1454]|uniref:alginate export family protein n=1 Tax=Thalassomonas sp. M1454 TaxID=2594477 RepID=UPI0011809FE4|nr:alginate export family protein [Thalassomonas sp. M1454]TRX53988.1 hypothetical protein FNN08_13640 [Thalassomonas sp. M1454]